MDVATAGTAPNVAGRLAAVQERITVAARNAGRDPASVTLVAVSKTLPPQDILPVVEAGVLDVGENRVQEAETKVAALPPAVRWHLVGHLQGNKINRALELFWLIHSVDRVELGQAIGERAQRRRRPAHVLLQVNVAGKEGQFGFTPEQVVPAARRLAEVPGLTLDGLMCIAPEVEDAGATRPYFRRLAVLFEELKEAMRASGHSWRHLSMGMTNDYPVAVEEGSTLIRVGRAIFGERPSGAGATGAAAGGEQVGERGTAGRG